MANGSVEETILRIGPPELPPASGRGVRYCAEASLVLAVLGLVCFLRGSGHSGFPELLPIAFVSIPLAFVLGIIGRRRGGESKVVATCAILILFPGVFLLCLIPVVPRGYRRAQFTHNLRQVGLALANYHQAYGRLPPAVVRDPDGRPLYSWRVLILPYLDEADLFEEFHKDERWDSPHNRSLLARGPRVYAGLGSGKGRETTFIQAFVGPGSAFASPRGEPLDNPDGSSNFPDGVSNTILAVEAREPVPWSAPFDLPTGPELPQVELGGGYFRERGLMESQPRINNLLVLFADGTVKSKPWPIAPEVLRAWITRNGGETIPDEP